MLLWLPALLAAGLGVAVLVAAVAWRRGASRLDERAAGEGIEARAMREGGALGFALVGLGLLAVAVGYLGTLGSLVAGAGTGGSPLAALAGTAWLYDVGGAALLGGFGVLIVAGLVPVACDVRRRFR